MPDLRRIGTWVSGGRHLDGAFDALVQHEFTAAQMFLTRPATTAIFDLEDPAAIRARTPEIAMFVHAPYAVALFPPLVKHGRQMMWMKQFGRAVDNIGAGMVLHFGNHSEYLDTDVQAARQMIEVIPETVPIYIENAGGIEWRINDWVRVIEMLRRGRPNVWACFDTAHAWSRGWGGFFSEDDERRRTEAFRNLRPYLGLLHVNNTFVRFGSGEQGEYFPLFNGNISPEQFMEILTGFPDVPVILERSQYMQAVVDRAGVIAMDGRLIHTLEALKKDPLTRQFPS